MNSKSSSERLFMTFIYLILAGLFIVTFYPFWNVFIISLNDATDTIKGGLYLLPRVLSLKSYIVILTDIKFTNSIIVTVLRTIVGTPLALLCTSMGAYALSKRELIGYKFFRMMFIFTMYFGGGLIPYYMILKAVHLIDSFWVYIIPNLVNVFYMILITTFINQLPGELEESARLDGANDLLIFFRIILPLSAPILATIALFIAINHWNSFFDSYIFVHKAGLKTLQAILVSILNQYQTGDMMSASDRMSAAAGHREVSPDSIRMAATMVATIPIILVYPFLQKYFVNGIMVGAIKA